MSQGQGGGQKQGAYLGGIRAVEDLRCRCRINEETGCWHWSLSIVQGGPSVHFVDSEGIRRKMRGRRAALILSGKNVPASHTAYAKLVCKSSDCVNPDHCRSGKKGSENVAMAESGMWKNNPKKMNASRLLAEKRRKLTDEQAAEIRGSDLTHQKLSEAYGLSRYAIWCIQVGKSYKPKGYGIFSGAL